MSFAPQGAEGHAEPADGSIEFWRQRVFAQALHWRNRPEDAEDIAQEAALRLLRWPHLAQYPSARWVARITMHCAIAHARLHRPHEEIVDELADASEPVAEVDRERIRSALAQISVPDAQYLILRYEFGWSVATIAEALGVSEGAAKIGLFRARHRLRSAIFDLAGSC